MTSYSVNGVGTFREEISSFSSSLLPEGKFQVE